MINEDDATQRSAREAAAERAFQLSVPTRTRERRRVKGAATLVVVILAVFGFASYEFVANAGHAQHPAAASHPRAKLPAAPVSTTSTQPSSAPASPTATATASPVAPPRALAITSVAAFGPNGLADGEHPQNAARALSGDAATPWLSYWYASPDFFDLPAGTGLLLDMGRAVSVTSVRVSVNGHGADLELRAGRQPTPAWLPEVAAVFAAGGTVRLEPKAPVHVRYLLIWFTHLPPDPAGTYQASVYQVTVEGHPAT